VKRGEIWWASLPEPIGSGPGLRRPVLVIQSNPFNESRIATVVVAVVTSNIVLAEAPGNARLSKSESGLPKASAVNVSQVLTIDRSLLTERVRVLSAPVMQRINDGLRLALGL
jgi:mRNA interferase MazF